VRIPPQPPTKDRVTNYMVLGNLRLHRKYAHRYLQIAFAEELYLYCQANDINFPELRDALNTKWNVEIPEPREGIGRHCLLKDTKMFLESTSRRKSKILIAAMEVDEDYKR
jgi:UDP-N-acetyl-D-mannosaminuronic acid dehydrogenase